jgi:hypothetical protein
LPPTLSIIMPTYNGAQFLASALGSIQQQQDDDLELVIVDDGSTDTTLEVVQDFARTLPIQLLTPGRLKSWVAATNMGLRAAKGEWACFLHQDDLWLPGRLPRLRQEMKAHSVPMIVHNAIFVDPEGKSVGPWTCPFSEGVIPSHQFLEHLLVQNFIAIPSPVFLRTAVTESGGLKGALWFSADWDLWLRLGALGPVRFIAETLSAFRIHPASQTAARKLQPGEWEQQLSSVLYCHLDSWSGTGRSRASLVKAAEASISVNAALAAASRGEPAGVWSVLRRLLLLTPWQWVRFLRDSRIIERVGARLRVQRQRSRRHQAVTAEG